MKNLFLSLVITTTLLHAQIDTLWTKAFGDELRDWGYGIVEIENGYILAGIKQLTNSHAAVFYGTDLDGEIIWEFDYGESGESFAGNLIKTDDGNIASLIYSSQVGPILIKMNMDGNIIFEKEYDVDLSSIYNLINTSDGGYAFLSAGVLHKTDSEGEIVWSEDGLESDSYAIIESSDGCIVVISSGMEDPKLIKYNMDGVEIFESEAENIGTIFRIFNVAQTQNYFIGSGENGILLFWDLNGNWVGAYSLNFSENWLRIWDVLQASDGSYYFSGIHDNNGVDSGAIGKFSLSEDDYYYFEEIFVLEWTQVLGPGRTYDFLMNNEEEISMIGGYVTNPDDQSTYDIWLIKFGPAGPPPPPPPTLVINEFLALNGNCCTDNQGDNDDYIELFNYGNEEVNIGGLYITDDMGNQSSYYQIPDGDNSTIIQPGDRLLLWADNESEQGPLHLGFKLNGTGEHLALYTVDGDSLIDEISFGTQDIDISYGRYPDGGDNWGFMDPTPNEPNSETLTIGQSSLSPKTFTLHQNYPNPFNPATTLQYDLPEDEFVSIIIYDMLGNVINNLVNDNQNSGYKSVQWNATNNQGQQVSAGVYLYSIEAGEFRQTKKMILLK